MYMYNAIDSTNLEQKFDSPGEPEIHRQNSIILTTFVLYVFTKYIPVKGYSNKQKFDSPGEP